MHFAWKVDVNNITLHHIFKLNISSFNKQAMLLQFLLRVQYHLIMCAAECKGLFITENWLGRVVVTWTFQFILYLLLDCNQCEKEGASSIPLRAQGMNTSPVCAGQDKLGWWSGCIGNTCLCLMLCPELMLLVGPPVNQIFSAGCQLSNTCPSALGALC